MEKQKKEKKGLKQSFQNRNFHYGIYSLGITALVLAILVVLNLVVSILPTSITNVDLSPSLLYSIGDVSKEVADNLQEDVDIIVVAETGSVDERITNFLNNYADLSEHLHLSEVDPVLHPDVMTKYDITSDGIVVRCEATDKSTSILFSDIIVTGVNSSYYQQTGQYVQEEKSFDGEGQLTSAVDYVTSTETHKMYRLTQHGEASLAENLTTSLTKSNITVEDLDLMSESSIPEDGEVLLINGATSDITEDEENLLLDYMKAGGTLMVTLAPSGSTKLQELPRLETVLNEYGIETSLSFVGDESRYYQKSLYSILPVQNDTEILKNVASDTPLLMQLNQAFTHREDARSSLTYTDLLTTSESGFTYSVDSEEKSEDGTQLLGTMVTETTGTSGDVKSTLFVFGSASLIDSSIIDQFSNVGNATAFVDCVSSTMDNVSNISIPAKSLEVSTNTNTATGGGMAWGALFMVIIPVVLVITGFVIWFRRRRK